MPQLIEHIDAIARQQGRDVLYIEFHPEAPGERKGYDYARDPVRAAVLAWLDGHAVPWRECGPIADLRIMSPYRGQVYVDVPYDEALPAYRAVRDYLEHPDGSMRQPGVRFYLLTHKFAMKNAEHDEPGFWERWYEDF